MSQEPQQAISPARIRVHNADLWKDVMESADWSDGPQGPRAAPTGAPRDAARLATFERQAKQREAFLQKQSVREHEVQQRFEVVKRETERRAKERGLQKELEFEERFSTFKHNNETLVQEVDGAIKADVAWRQRKKERLFNEWTNKIFEPMQADIQQKLSSLSREDIEGKRRHMLQCFLDESNRKANGLFRDIIIESDYDPLAQAQGATLKFKAPNVADDPTKNRATREMGDRLASGLTAFSRGGPEPPKPSKNAVPVTMWNRMEATPYGRYSDEPDSMTVKKPDFLKSAVVMSHFDVPTGSGGARLVREENSLRGKKMVPPVQLPSIHECFSGT